MTEFIGSGWFILACLAVMLLSWLTAMAILIRDQRRQTERLTYVYFPKKPETSLYDWEQDGL